MNKLEQSKKEALAELKQQADEINKRRHELFRELEKLDLQLSTVTQQRLVIRQS